MSENKKSIIFAVIVAFICSILLTAASTGLKDFQVKNIEIDKQKNVLKAVGLIKEDEKYTSVEIEKLFKDNIQRVNVNEDGEIVKKAKPGNKYLPIYLNSKNGNTVGYIIPINTRGLWGEIKGYLALDNDGSTIRGFTVYKHQETPGLGGEIENNWFRKNFVGKKIVDADNNFVSISIAKGMIPKEKEKNMVDGISGATLTGKYLTEGLRDILRDYENVSVRFRMGKKDIID